MVEYAMVDIRNGFILDSIGHGNVRDILRGSSRVGIRKGIC